MMVSIACEIVLHFLVIWPVFVDAYTRAASVEKTHQLVTHEYISFEKYCNIQSINPNFHGGILYFMNSKPVDVGEPVHVYHTGLASI